MASSASSAQSTHPYTCNTCQVAFKSGEIQRTHMQTDWHRYNLKRRMASLPPLSSEIFTEKVLASQADAAATAARALFEKACDACQKNYYSENAFDNHLHSKKHKINLAHSLHARRTKEEDTRSIMSSTFSLGDASGPHKPKENIDEDAEEEFTKVVDGIKNSHIDDDEDAVNRRPTRPHPSRMEDHTEHPLSPANESQSSKPVTGDIPKEQALRQCLFCHHLAESLDENMQHMKKMHSLFIPERDFLTDLEGLILHLSSKVYNDYECIYCGRLKWSEEGITTHMRDTNHCKIAYDTEAQKLDLGDYYDFRGTYSEDEEDEDMDDDKDEAGWETSSTASSVPTEELGMVYEDTDKPEIKDRLQRNRHHSHGNTTRHKSVDGFHSHAHQGFKAVYHDEFELHLPTGRVAGHRSLNRYFKQNLRNYPTPAERADRLLTQGEDNSDVEMGDGDEGQDRGRGRRRDQQVVSRANGGLGMIAVSDAKKREVQLKEKKEQKREERAINKVQWRNNKQNNFQKHFRDPLLQ